MPSTLAISPDQFQQLDRRLQTIEQAMVRLTKILSQRHLPDDSFTDLYNSAEFAQHVRETKRLLVQDKTKFVDPFATYSD